MTRGILTAPAVVVLVALALVWGQLPALGAGGLLHPARHVTTEHCVAADFAGAGVSLKGWRCAASTPPRGSRGY